MVTTTPEQAWDILRSRFKADTDYRATFAGMLNLAEGWVTFTGLDDRPVTYWLSRLNTHDGYQDLYLTQDIEFGDCRIVLASDAGNFLGVSIGHWGGNLFDLNGLNLEGRLFGPFKFHS